MTLAYNKNYVHMIILWAFR